MPKLCYPVIYTVATSQQATTVKTDGTAKGVTEGSIFHPSQREFAGLIGRVNEDGTFSLVIFPPNRAPVWIDNARYQTGPGGFTEPTFEAETAAPTAAPPAEPEKT